MGQTGQVRGRRRWPWWAAGLFVVALVVVGAPLAHDHWRTDRGLERALAELDVSEPGWRLEDLEAARAEIPDAENSVFVIRNAAAKLPAKWWRPSLLDDLLELPPEEPLSPELRGRLQQALGPLLPALDVIGPLADKPRGRHRVVYASNILETVTPDRDRAYACSSALYLDIVRHAQRGEGALALRSCLALLNAGRSVGDEPLSPSQLCRCGLVRYATKGIERTLAWTTPGGDELGRLQAALEAEDQFDDTLLVARGERALGHRVLESVESGEVSLSRMSEPPAQPDRVVRFWWWVRNRVRKEHPFLLAASTQRVRDAQRPLDEQADLEADFVSRLPELRSMAPLTTRWAYFNLMLPGLNKLNEAFRRKHALLRSVAALLACERFRLETGGWPESLPELTPRFLRSVPLDPYDGKPLRFRRLADGVIVYAVNEDRNDDGGQIGLPVTQPGSDIGARLWDADRRRQKRGP
jgi:hypothetical protein